MCPDVTEICSSRWIVSVDLKALGESILGRATSNGFLVHLKGDDLRKTCHSKLESHIGTPVILNLLCSYVRTVLHSVPEQCCTHTGEFI